MSQPEEFFDGLDASFDKQAEDDKAKREADENTERWEPEAGDVLKGVFTEVKYLPTKFGVKPMLVITDGEGQTWEVWASPTVLRKAVEERMPHPGSLIGIRFDGFVETPEAEFDGYNMYLVSVPERDSQAATAGRSHWQEASQLGDIKAAQKEKRDTQSKGIPVDRPDHAPF